MKGVHIPVSKPTFALITWKRFPRQVRFRGHLRANVFRLQTGVRNGCDSVCRLHPITMEFLYRGLTLPGPFSDIQKMALQAVSLFTLSSSQIMS